jgi:protein TonB
MSANRSTRQTTAVTAVVGIHVVIGSALIAGTAMRDPPSSIRPVEAILVPPDAPPKDLLRRPPPPGDPRIPRLPLPTPGEIPIVPRNYDPVEMPPRDETVQTNLRPRHVPPIVQASVRDLRALAEAASGCYPSASRRLGEEGLVLLKIYVTAAGSVTDATVESSSGVARLDDAAVRCVRSSQLNGMWVPQTVSDQKVGAWMLLPWRWKLN